MSAKYFVYAGGRWREVETASGRVSGWRERARFMFASHGRLVAARRKVVLKGLKALAAGAPTSVKDGRRLSYTNSVSIQQSISRPRASMCQHCCNKSCGNIIQSKTIMNKVTTTRSTSPFGQVDLATTINKHTLNVKSQSADKSRNRQTRKSDLKNSDDEVVTKNNVPQSISNHHDKRKKYNKIHSPTKSKSFEQTKSESTSSDDEVLASKTVFGITSIKTKINSSKKSFSNLRKPEGTSSSDDFLASKHTLIKKSISRSKLPSPKKSRSSKQTTSLTSSSSDDETVSKKVSRTRTRKKSISKPLVLSPEKSRPLKRKRSISSTQSDDTLKSSISNTAPKKRRLGSLKLKPSPVKRTRISSSTSSDNSSKVSMNNKRKLISRKNTSARHPVTTSSDVAHVNKPKHYSPEMDIFSQRPVQQDRKPSNSDHIKELIIDESDVALLRSFLLRCSTDVVLHRFDTDDEYKRDVFFRINPLVDIERCKQIEEMLKKQLDDVSLKDFVSQLGLCSISECSSQSRRYKTRKPLSRHKKCNDIVSQSEDTDKENIMEMRKQKYKEGLSLFGKSDKVVNKPERVLRATHRKVEMSDRTLNNSSKVVEQKTSKITETKVLNRPGLNKNRRERDKIVVASSGTEDDSDVEKKLRDSPKKTVNETPIKQSTHTISKMPSRRNFKEYSNMEDHSIVAWVSTGGRARSVNGNKLWRELQDQYHSITGQKRTWHSLRNRYLRYILPSLGSLKLQPSHAARLRAAAATGELKSRKVFQRRNSILAAPSASARGAWSRRPRPAPAPSPAPAHIPAADEDATNKRQDNATEQLSPVKRRLRSSHHSPSPPIVTAGPTTRYSDVTRRFAQRHKERSTLSSSPAASQTPEPTVRPPDVPRSRRLYNPKVNL